MGMINNNIINNRFFYRNLKINNILNEILCLTSFEIKTIKIYSSYKTTYNSIKKNPLNICKSIKVGFNANKKIINKKIDRKVDYSNFNTHLFDLSTFISHHKQAEKVSNLFILSIQFSHTLKNLDLNRSFFENYHSKMQLWSFAIFRDQKFFYKYNTQIISLEIIYMITIRKLKEISKLNIYKSKNNYFYKNNELSKTSEIYKTFIRL